jgi:hypothetical protein
LAATAHPGFLVLLVRGDGAIHNTSSGQEAVIPVVQVLSVSGQPMAGLLVTFRAPAEGAGGLFGGSRTLSVVTDAGGFAFGRGLQPNHLAGAWDLQVHVCARGRTVEDRMAQINAFLPEAAPDEIAASRITLLDLTLGVTGLLAALGCVRLIRQIRRWFAQGVLIRPKWTGSDVVPQASGIRLATAAQRS